MVRAEIFVKDRALAPEKERALIVEELETLICEPVLDKGLAPEPAWAACNCPAKSMPLCINVIVAGVPAPDESRAVIKSVAPLFI